MKNNISQYFQIIITALAVCLIFITFINNLKSTAWSFPEPGETWII